jgi:hypothetical protein
MNLMEMKVLVDDGAVNKLFDLFRQGLVDAAAVPELQTEGESAAHHMLGCDNYIALIAIYGTALAFQETPGEAPESAVEKIFEIADTHLRRQVLAVVDACGPIGTHTCSGGWA